MSHLEDKERGDDINVDVSYNITTFTQTTDTKLQYSIKNESDRSQCRITEG
jgi:hypothetical protein